MNNKKNMPCPQSYGRRTHLPAIFVSALLITISMLVAGCARNENAPGFGNSSTTTSSSRTSSGKKSREEIKAMASNQGEATAADRGDFKIVYTPTNNPKYVEVNENLQKSGELQVIADELNAALSIPEDVTITFKECGEPNAFWSPPTRSITMCYELMEYFAETFRQNAKSEQELEEMISGATTFTFFHELGHGLVDILQLPATGKEEDAVDQLSLFVLLSSDAEEGGKMALSGAQWFWNNFQQTRESGASLEKLNWADEHSMDGARTFNIICWTYGSAPEKYQGLVNNPLPEARADRCPNEYARLSRAWLNLLKPYLKDAGRRALEQQQKLPGGENSGQPGQQQQTEGDEDEHGKH